MKNIKMAFGIAFLGLNISAHGAWAQSSCTSIFETQPVKSSASAQINRVSAAKTFFNERTIPNGPYDPQRPGTFFGLGGEAVETAFLTTAATHPESDLVTLLGRVSEAKSFFNERTIRKGPYDPQRPGTFFGLGGQPATGAFIFSFI